MPRKNQGWITFQSSPEEQTILEQYCQKSQRSKTEVLRELIRNLDSQGEEKFERVVSAGETKPETKISNLNFVSISARNRLWGKVKRVVLADINAEVTVEIAPGVEIVAVITKSSVQRFAVSPQKEVCVVIKSSDVMIAVEL